jgi:hypothetical protein
MKNMETVRQNRANLVGNRMKKSIIPLKKSVELPRVLSSAFIVVVLLFFVAGPLPAATTLLGNPFRPAGANYNIFARQGIDAAHPNGDPSFTFTQVNSGFEIAGALGISYQANVASSTLTDFGIGLYKNAAMAEVATGLNYQYDSLVQASSVTIRMVDFDINNTDTFFKSDKVEPAMLLYGAGGVVIASASPTDIFNSMVFVSTANDGTWDLNLGTLLAEKGMPDQPISGFLLYADNTDNEHVPSDPFFILSVTNGVVVPEAGNFVAGLAAIAFGGIFHLRQVRRKRKAEADTP